MQSQEITTLYTLKNTANQHLKIKQFSHAAVYYADIITKLDVAFQKITTEEQMQKLIKEIKIPAHKNLSLCYLKLNENMACVQQCEEVLKIEPNCIKTLYRIAKAFMNLKEYEEAEKYLKRGFAIDPNEQEIQKALSEIQTARNTQTKSQQSFINLKRLVALILYWPLLILNTILAKIFGNPTKAQQKQRTA